jgi:hypothetical protein
MRRALVVEDRADPDEFLDEEAEQFDSADHERYEDRQAGRGDVVVDLADRG